MKNQAFEPLRPRAQLRVAALPQGDPRDAGRHVNPRLSRWLCKDSDQFAQDVAARNTAVGMALLSTSLDALRDRHGCKA